MSHFVFHADTDCFEWPEWHLLEFLRRTKNSEKSAAVQSSQQSGVMTPSGEYVVLEVRIGSTCIKLEFWPLNFVVAAFDLEIRLNTFH